MDMPDWPPTSDFKSEANLEAQQTAQHDELESLARQQARLRCLEAEFRAFADSVRDYAFVTLDPDEKVIAWNKGAEAVLGYSQSEILGRSGAVFFTPEDIAHGEPEREASVAVREGRAEDERWHLRKDGTQFWGSSVLTPLRAASGELRGYAKVVRDRTAERQFQKALRIREERLRVLIENLPDCAVLDLGRNGDICAWNSGAERIFGHTASEMVGLGAGELLAMSGYPSDSFHKDLEIALTCGRSEGESWMTRKDGTRFFGRWITTCVHSGDGEVAGFILVMREETRRQETRDEEQRWNQSAWEVMEQQARATSWALRQTQAELAEIGRRLLNVQEEERRRIARELHDHLAQRLALLEMGLERLREGLPSNLEQLRSEVGTLQEQTAALCQDVREMSHRLHPSIIEHLGLVTALKSLCTECQHTRLAPLDFKAEHDGGAIPLDVATAFYRICEEALRNVQKHAGDVPVSVHIQGTGAELRLSVQDAGPGFDPDGVDAIRHLGLLSMRERAGMVGATCTCTSQPGKGTIIEVCSIAG